MRHVRSAWRKGELQGGKLPLNAMRQCCTKTGGVPRQPQPLCRAAHFGDLVRVIENNIEMAMTFLQLADNRAGQLHFLSARP